MSIQHRLATPVIQPRMRFFDTDGKPLVGGKVYAFKVGTDEFKPTYRNSELTALNTNPVVLDGAGSALIYLRGANLLKIYDRYGNFIEERIEYQQRERAQFYDDYGRPLKNGYVYTYDYQSTIRKTSYSIDDAINPNPIVLDENGTALVNIVGAYRLRQYNSKNVFVGDQDFKRLPVKALTSVVYPLYFDDAFDASFSIDNIQITKQVAYLNTQAPVENISTTFSIDNVSFRTPRNEGYLDESVSTTFSIDNVSFRTPLNKGYLDESVSTSFNIDNVQITKTVNYLNTTLDVESIGTTFSIDNAQITN